MGFDEWGPRQTHSSHARDFEAVSESKTVNICAKHTESCKVGQPDSPSSSSYAHPSNDSDEDVDYGAIIRPTHEVQDRDESDQHFEF